MAQINQNPEQRARDNIDAMLAEAGWKVQDSEKIDFNAGLGIAVREFQTDIGPADYALFVDKNAVGIIEAKPEDWGHRITMVEEQSASYAAAQLKWVNNKEPLPLVYESTGVVTRFTDGRDPKPRSREVFSFHRPETVQEWLAQSASLRARLQTIPPLNHQGLRDCQISAIENLETSFKDEQEMDDLTYNRQDFWATTSNKQLNFVQHIRTMLKTTGRAAVVVPDNVLFEGGAGEIVRKKLLENTDLHTILRLPTSIFYANGVKANVIFFDNREANPNPWTKEVWYYDYRTNVHHTLKKKTMRFEDLAEFIKCYNTANRRGRKETWHATKNPEGRWRRFAYDNLKARDKTSLDVFWLKDKSLTDLDNLPEPEDLAEEIIENLEAGLNSFKEVLAGLNKVA